MAAISLKDMEATRAVRPFKVVSEYVPSGDQPGAIAELAGRINAGETDVVLLGATGTGKSATTAWLIEQVQRPTLVLSHTRHWPRSSRTSSETSCRITRWSTS